MTCWHIVENENSNSSFHCSSHNRELINHKMWSAARQQFLRILLILMRKRSWWCVGYTTTLVQGRQFLYSQPEYFPTVFLCWALAFGTFSFTWLIGHHLVWAPHEVGTFHSLFCKCLFFFNTIYKYSPENYKNICMCTRTIEYGVTL